MEAIFVQTPFFFHKYQKITTRSSKPKLQDMVKKNDKDETGNVLLDLMFFSPSITYHKKGE